MCLQIQAKSVKGRAFLAKPNRQARLHETPKLKTLWNFRMFYQVPDEGG